MEHLRRWALCLTWIAFAGAGCGGSGAGEGDAGDQGKPAGHHQAQGDSGTGDDAGTLGDSGADTDAEADDAGGDSGPVDPGAPKPAKPCAEDPDADQHPNSDVNQVTGTVHPDLGVVPDGGAFTGDPAQNGPYGVLTKDVKVPIKAGTLKAAGYTITVTAGTLSGTIYVPSEDNGQTAAAGPFPLVLVLPGFEASYTMYATYSNHFASHGFAVLGVDTRSTLTTASHDKEAFELKQTIDWVSSDASPLKGRLDLTKIAVAGHSKGGKLAFFIAAIDPRVDFVIGWDPSNTGGPPCSLPIPGECNAFPVAPNCQVPSPGIEHLMHAESLVLGMPRDSALNPDRHHNSIHFYRGAPSPASLVYFDASHIAPMSNQAVIAINKTVQMAMLLARFKGMTGLDAFLPTSPLGHANLEKLDLVIRVETK